MLLWAAALLTDSIPTTTNPKEVDQALVEFFYRARSDLLLHRLSHYVCGVSDRKRQNREFYNEDYQLERQYVRQGGIFASPEEQEISLEAYHFTCPQDREERKKAGELWDEIANSVEDELAKARHLLAQQKRVLRQQSVP